MTIDEALITDTAVSARSTVATGGTAVRERAERGRTVVDDRVRRKLIEHAVLSVPGTERHRSLPTRQLPAVRFGDRDHTEVDVQIAAQWPLDAARLVPSVRSAVNRELERSLGLRPAAVHVHVTRVAEERSAPAIARPQTEAETETAEPTDLRALRQRAPRRAAGASIATAPLLLALLVLGGLAVRDTIVSLGWAAGDRWLDAVPRIADDVRWDWWAWPATIGAIVVGLVLLVAAVKPRRHSHTPVTDELWFSRRIDVDRRTAEEVAR